jgi:hypothetical protein
MSDPGEQRRSRYGGRNWVVRQTVEEPKGRTIMTMTKKWTVDIYLDEHPDTRRTHAEARLHAGDRADISGIGTSSRNPRDVDVPEIGDELAAARALANLAEKLRLAAVGDIESYASQASHGW